MMGTFQKPSSPMPAKDKPSKWAFLSLAASGLLSVQTLISSVHILVDRTGLMVKTEILVLRKYNPPAGTSSLYFKTIIQSSTDPLITYRFFE